MRAPRGRTDLPDFPWDTLAGAAARARAHPGGIVDLSVGTPVDPTPAPVAAALAAAVDAPGYPQTAGTMALRDAAAGWLARRGLAVSPDAVVPTIGSKEFVALLPLLLGLGPASTVAVPRLAYPTYAVGAALVGARVTAWQDGVGDADLVWVNSPSNPTGEVATPGELADLVAACRDSGALLVSDECYLDFGWESRPLSVLDASVSGGSHEGLLAVHSLSKRSNMAGYRAGLVSGDPEVVAAVVATRKHLGLMTPAPVQAAATVAWADDAHVDVQRARYAARRALLRPALGAAGFRVEDSPAGLYLWATRGEADRTSVDWLAARGILVAPGSFYGDAGARHIRVALTATDERVAAAADRLTA